MRTRWNARLTRHHGGQEDTGINVNRFQSTIASIHHPSVTRSRKIRYTAPSLSETSHSSRFQYVDDGSHQLPDVRHGPAHASTCPPASPRRSEVTATGRPSATATRAGTGRRQRRKADTMGTAEVAEAAEPSEAVRVT